MKEFLLPLRCASLMIFLSLGCGPDGLIGSGGDDSLDEGISKGSDNLVPGGQLNSREYLASANGRFRFYLQSDGNLTLRNWSTRESLWASDTNGKAGIRFNFQRDGNLVLYTRSNSPVWASNTVGPGVTLLKLQDNGILALYRGSSVIWSVPTEVVDNCPNDPNKTEPGQCGCGKPEGTCGDGGVDLCPNDPNKTEPGQCGCGTPEGTCGGDEVLPTDTVLTAPDSDGPIIAPIAGFNWHTRSDHATEVPAYQNVDRDSDEYWNFIVDELLLARVHLVLWHGRYCDSLVSGTSGRGDMCPRWLTKYVAAAKRAGAEHILKAGFFDDTGNYPNAAGVDRLDLSNRNNWKYFWDHRMKILFDTVPKSMWYLLDGKPVVVFWNLSDSNFSNQQGNTSALLSWLKSKFREAYGMEPAFILQDDWLQHDTTISRDQIAGVHSWFHPKTDNPSTIYSYHSFNGAIWGCLAPSYSKTDRTVSRRDGSTLDNALAAGANAKFIILESWTNWAERAGFYRSKSWRYLNQYINITRKYAEPTVQTLRFQAEAADSFSDMTGSNLGGEYIDRALDVEKLSDNSGWYVGWTQAGEWIEYQEIKLASGTYRFTARVATDAQGKKLRLDVGGLPSVTLPNTGGLNNYQLVHLGEVNLSGGTYNLRLIFETGDINIDWFFLKRK